MTKENYPWTREILKFVMLYTILFELRSRFQTFIDLLIVTFAWWYLHSTTGILCICLCCTQKIYWRITNFSGDHCVYFDLKSHESFTMESLSVRVNFFSALRWTNLTDPIIRKIIHFIRDDDTSKNFQHVPLNYQPTYYQMGRKRYTTIPATTSTFS